MKRYIDTEPAPESQRVIAAKDLILEALRFMRRQGIGQAEAGTIRRTIAELHPNDHPDSLVVIPAIHSLVRQDRLSLSEGKAQGVGSKPRLYSIIESLKPR